MDSDYLILTGQGASHAGIAYAKPGTRSVGQLIQKLKLIHDVLIPAEMENHIDYSMVKVELGELEYDGNSLARIRAVVVRLWLNVGTVYRRASAANSR